MSIIRLAAWTVAVHTCVTSSLVSAAESPMLPDRYAEVVLRVEGMV